MILLFQDPNLPLPSDVLAGSPPYGPFLDQFGTLEIPSIPAPLTGVMNFRVITQALIDTLGLSADGRFQVVGYRRQGKAAEEVKGNKRIVQVYHHQGDFPKSAGGVTGPTQNNLVFGIGLTVSAKAKANLSVINAPGATSAQITAALTALSEASYEADILLDELGELVYQILMDGRTIDLNLPKGIMSNRWVSQMRKDEPNPNGEMVVLTGMIQYTCNTVELAGGLSGSPLTSVTTALSQVIT